MLFRQINGVDLTNATHNQVVTMLKMEVKVVTLVVYRENNALNRLSLRIPEEEFDVSSQSLSYSLPNLQFHPQMAKLEPGPILRSPPGSSVHVAPNSAAGGTQGIRTLPIRRPPAKTVAFNVSGNDAVSSRRSSQLPSVLENINSDSSTWLPNRQCTSENNLKKSNLTDNVDALFKALEDNYRSTPVIQPSSTPNESLVMNSREKPKNGDTMGAKNSKTNNGSAYPIEVGFANYDLFMKSWMDTWLICWQIFYLFILNLL